MSQNEMIKPNQMGLIGRICSVAVCVLFIGLFAM